MRQSWSNFLTRLAIVEALPLSQRASSSLIGYSSSSRLLAVDRIKI